VLLPLVILSTGLCVPASAVAQDGAGASESGRVQVDPETGERYRVVRPPEGVRRGRISVSAWVAIAGGVLLVLAAAGTLTARLAQRTRDPGRGPGP